MTHVSSSDLVRVSVGIPLLDIEPRASSSITANCHELALPTLPAFVQVTSVVAAKIALSWSTTAPIGSVDNLASTKTSLRTSTSLFFQVPGLCFDFTRHVWAMGQSPRCSPLVNVFLWRESSLSASKSGGPTCSPLHQVPNIEVTLSLIHI